MKKYYEGDTGGGYLVGACGFGYFADVQTVAQAEDAAWIWWRMTGDDGGVIIRERDGGIVKVMRREADKEKAEMTDKEKIIEIVAPFVSAYGEDEAIADALIAANIGDVTEWKERTEKAGSRLKIAKQKLKKANMCYGTARLEHLNGDPYEILCPHCGENIKFHVSNTCPYCNALLFKKTGREEKDKHSDILQLKSFCERNGIKCILTRRTEDFNGKFKERDGYKITFMNGDVIQSADTNGYFEFYNRHNEVDGKRIEKTKAKSFVLRYKNWLNSNNKPKREIDEEEK